VAAVFIHGEAGALHEALGRADPSLAFVDRAEAADLVLVPLDATAPDPVAGWPAEFANCESHRLFEHRPGGWPLGFVLANCDQLLERGDTVADWLARVEGRRVAVEVAIRSRLSAFGRVVPFAAAVAARVPAIGGAPVDATGGLGIVALAESIRQFAKAHRTIDRSSRHRLIGTAAMAVAAMLLLAAFAVAAAIVRPATDDRLTGLVRQYQLRERPAAARLSEARRPRTKAELVALRDDSSFRFLSPDLREFVEDRLRELQRYDDYAKRFAPPQLAAGECRSLDELDRLTNDLRTRLAPPADDAEAWRETEMVRLRRKWAAEIDALRATEETVRTGYADAAARLHRLVLASTLDRRWRDDCREALVAEPVAVNRDAPLAGSVELPVRGGELLTAATAFEFDRPFAARREYDSAKDRLTRLVELADAIGLIDDAEMRPGDARLKPMLDSPLAYAVPNWGDPNRDLIRARIERLLDRHTEAMKRRIRESVSVGQPTAVGWLAWGAKVRESWSADDEHRMWLETLRTGRRPESR
jgi:hypothetical protein